jgi:hypothetical protein
LDATPVSDILSFRSRPRGYLEKHLTMILLDIGKEQVCLMYRSTRVYHYDTTIDWFILLLIASDRENTRLTVNKSSTREGAVNSNLITFIDSHC